MNTLRVARVALRARPTALRVPLQRRTYADAAPDKVSVSPSITLPTTFRLTCIIDQAELVPSSPGTKPTKSDHYPPIYRFPHPIIPRRISSRIASTMLGGVY